MQESREPPSEANLIRALDDARTAAYVLRDLDFDALDDLDSGAVADWERSLVEARRTLLDLLDHRGGEELEAPPRGQLDRFDEARVKHHVQGISKALLVELERADATQGGMGQVSTSVLFGLLYSLRGIEQFIRWVERRGQERARLLEAPQAPAPAPELPAPAPTVLFPPAAPGSAAAAEFTAQHAKAYSSPAGGLFQWNPDLEPREEPPPAAPGFVPSLPPPLPEPPKPAPPPPPPPPRRRDVDLSAYFKAPDEYGEAFRMPPISIFHGATRGPELAKRAVCLDATRVVPIPGGGVAFALADGPDSSIGARVAAQVVTAAFCEVLAAGTEAPADAKGAVTAAAEGARGRLDALLLSLVESADDSDAITRVRGSLPPRTVRKILEHTLHPDPALRHVTPALSVTFVAGVLLSNLRDGFELTLLSVGGAVVERKQRGQGAEVLVPVEGAARLAPGAAIPWQPAALAFCGPLELKPADIVLVGCPALRRGFWGSAFEKLSQLCPEILQLGSQDDEHVLAILRQAGAAADRFEALEGRRALALSAPDAPSPPTGIRRHPLFGDDLSAVLITLAPRGRPITAPVPSAAAGDPVTRATREALSTLVRLIKKPPGK